MEWAQQFVEQYGYWAVFLWTLIEGETVFIAAAALAAAGIMQPWKVIVVAASGAFIGHLIFFSLGRWRGMQIIESIPSLHRHYPKANIILDKYAHWFVQVEAGEEGRVESHAGEVAIPAAQIEHRRFERAGLLEQAALDASQQRAESGYFVQVTGQVVHRWLSILIEQLQQPCILQINLTAGSTFGSN